MSKPRKKKPQGHPARVNPPMKNKITATSAEGLLGAFMADWRDHNLKRMQVLRQLLTKYPTVEGAGVASHYAGITTLSLVQAVDELAGEEETIFDRIKNDTI